MAFNFKAEVLPQGPFTSFDYGRYVKPTGSDLRYQAGKVSKVQSDNTVTREKFWNTPEKNLIQAILDGIITDIATYLRKPNSREDKKNYRMIKLWVEDDCEDEGSFLWAITSLASTEDLKNLLVETFRAVVIFKLSPTCIHPDTLRRLF